MLFGTYIKLLSVPMLPLESILLEIYLFLCVWVVLSACMSALDACLVPSEASGIGVIGVSRHEDSNPRPLEEQPVLSHLLSNLSSPRRPTTKNNKNGVGKKITKTHYFGMEKWLLS